MKGTPESTLNYRDLFRRAAIYVDKILKGTKLGYVLLEFPTKLELVINLPRRKCSASTCHRHCSCAADEVSNEGRRQATLGAIGRCKPR